MRDSDDDTRDDISEAEFFETSDSEDQRKLIADLQNELVDNRKLIIRLQKELERVRQESKSAEISPKTVSQVPGSPGLSLSPTDNFTRDVPLESVKRPLAVNTNPLMASIRNRGKVAEVGVAGESSSKASSVASASVEDISVDRSEKGKGLTSEQQEIVNKYKRMAKMLPLGAVVQKAMTEGYDLSGITDETADKAAEVERLLTEKLLNPKKSEKFAESKTLSEEQEEIINKYKGMIKRLPLGAVVQKAKMEGYDLSGITDETADKAAEVEKILTEQLLNPKKKEVSKKVTLPVKKVEAMALADFSRPIDDIRGKLNTQTASSITNNGYLRSAINSGNVEAAVLLTRKVADAKPVEVSDEHKQEALREASILLIQNIENLSAARDQDGKTAVDRARIGIEDVKAKYSRIGALPIDAPEFEQARETLTFEQFQQQNRALPKVLREKYRLALLDKVYPNRTKDEQTEIQAATEVLESEKSKCNKNVASIGAAIGIAIKSGVDPSVLTVEARKIENPATKGVINGAITNAKQSLTNSPTKAVKEIKTPVKSIIEDGEFLHPDTIRLINVYHTKAKDENIPAENKTLSQSDVKDAVMYDLVAHAIKLRKYNEILEASGSGCPDLEKHLEAAFKHNMRKALNYKQDPGLAQNNEILITSMLKSFKEGMSDPEMIASVEVPIDGVDIRREMNKSLRELGVREDAIKLGAVNQEQKVPVIMSATSISSRPFSVPDARTGDRTKSINTF